MPATRVRQRRPGSSDTRRASALRACSGPGGCWPWGGPAGRPSGGARQRGAPGQGDLGRASPSPSGAGWRTDIHSAWPLPAVAVERQRRRARLQSGDAGSAGVRGRSDGRKHPASVALRMVRELSPGTRLWRRAIAQACPQGRGWTHASRAMLPSAKSILGFHDAVTIPEAERDHPAQEEGKSPHKKKPYPRKIQGVTVENVSRFCPTKIGVNLRSVLEFIDAGYSGSSLVRPGLERLRDVAAAGGIDRLYVHCPDRLARNYAHQVLLLEEFIRAGVEVIFLNREVGQTPEDQLLLQVQGMIAEYERAKMLERSRRGKRHGAQVGKVSVLGGAPYGYRYVTKQEGAGEAHFEVVEEEARVVRQVFEWVGQDRLTIGEVRRRLEAAKERTRTGKTVWDRATIGGMLHNPAYKGEAAFGKTAIEPLRPRLRAQRGRPLQPKHAYSHHDVPCEQWMSIP